MTFLTVELRYVKGGSNIPRVHSECVRGLVVKSRELGIGKRPGNNTDADTRKAGGQTGIRLPCVCFDALGMKRMVNYTCLGLNLIIAEVSWISEPTR